MSMSEEGGRDGATRPPMRMGTVVACNSDSLARQQVGIIHHPVQSQVAPRPSRRNCAWLSIALLAAAASLCCSLTHLLSGARDLWPLSLGTHRTRSGRERDYRATVGTRDVLHQHAVHQLMCLLCANVARAAIAVRFLR
eukprot:7113014-Prymnesium_polylepis.3